MRQVINGQPYTLSQLKALIAAIVKLNIGKELSGEDYVFAYWALKRRRPELTNQPKIRAVEDKSGKHLQYFSGTEWEDFSYYKACKGTTSVDRGNIQKAFRYEVYSQTRAFRDKEIQKAKHKHLLELHKQDTFAVHVDHVIPFHLLLADFLKLEGLSLEDTKIRKHASLNTFTLVDPKLSARWQEFHKKHAQLKLTSASDNLAKAHSYDLPLWRYKQALA